MPGHELKVVAEGGRLRRVELDGQPLMLSLGGLTVWTEPDAGGAVNVRLGVIVDSLELDLDEVSLERLEAELAHARVNAEAGQTDGTTAGGEA